MARLPAKGYIKAFGAYFASSAMNFFDHWAWKRPNMDSRSTGREWDNT
jgi:hypothetical protein